MPLGIPVSVPPAAPKSPSLVRYPGETGALGMVMAVMVMVARTAMHFAHGKCVDTLLRAVHAPSPRMLTTGLGDRPYHCTRLVDKEMQPPRGQIRCPGVPARVRPCRPSPGPRARLQGLQAARWGPWGSGSHCASCWWQFSGRKSEARCGGSLSLCPCSLPPQEALPRFTRFASPEG